MKATRQHALRSSKILEASREVFLRDAQGNDVFLFEYQTGRGPIHGPTTRLWGNGDDEVLGTFEQSVFLDGDGNFTGTVKGNSNQEWE